VVFTSEAAKRGQAAARVKVEKRCQECGKEYQVIRVASTKSKRCPECQEEFEIVNRKENRRRHQEAKKKLGEGRKLDVRMVYYRVVWDPEESWGFCSVLPDGDVQRLLKLRYLTVGTVLETGGQRVEVVKDKMGALRLFTTECTESTEKKLQLTPA
jgi:hypothetical protein